MPKKIVSIQRIYENDETIDLKYLSIPGHYIPNWTWASYATKN